MPKNTTLEYFRKLLNCELIEYVGFTDENDNNYGIYMDEEGLFKNLPPNQCAKNLLGKIKKINWGTFTGWFAIFKYDRDDPQPKLDMNITPKEFIDRFNDTLEKRK